MSREYKIEIEDDVNYEFFVHDDNKFESVNGVEPTPMSYYTDILSHTKQMVILMRKARIDRFQVTKLL